MGWQKYNVILIGVKRYSLSIIPSENVCNKRSLPAVQENFFCL